MDGSSNSSFNPISLTRLSSNSDMVSTHRPKATHTHQDQEVLTNGDIRTRVSWSENERSKHSNVQPLIVAVQTTSALCVLKNQNHARITDWTKSYQIGTLENHAEDHMISSVPSTWNMLCWYGWQAGLSSKFDQFTLLSLSLNTFNQIVEKNSNSDNNEERF